ncbi:MAG TPA: phosphoglycerate dehydrogenase [Polyangiaceae bacterium]|nr:phosphoglycerate dehydrogenase [Polyangiaceae bacterium]
MSQTSYPKSKIKVLLLENIHETARTLFRADGLDLEVLPGALSESELIERIPEVHLLGIRSKTNVTPAVLDAGKRLLGVGCFCIGTNQVALEEAHLRGVPVFNAPFSNTRSVAELVISHVVALARHVSDQVRDMHAGIWNKSATGSYEVRGKTLGIVGYGRIGRQVGVLAEAMGMTVYYTDIEQQLPMGNNRFVPELDELLRRSDFVTLHVPETAETKNMIGAAQIAQMKKGSRLINLARGTVVEIPALADALKSGHLAGAAVDVFPEEPAKNGPGFVSELVGLRNVILTPHVGGSTEEAQENIGTEVGQRLLDYLNAGMTTGSVNFPQVGQPLLPGKHRILNVHQNVPGVLTAINGIISATKANVSAQVLATDPTVGYLVMDLDRSVSDEVKEKVSALDTSIRTRILY